MRTPLTHLAAVLATLVLLAGCSPPRGGPAKDRPKAEPKNGHAHSHDEGPHGGTVIEWMGKYHLEFTVDHAKQEATVYVLGGDVKKPRPIKADKLTLSIKEPPFQVELKAEPLEGEGKGLSSRFVGKHEKLGKEQEFAGTISGVVDGKPYSEDFKEEPHEHEEKGPKK